MNKINVNGNEQHPLWEWMKKEKKGIMWTKGIKWNFTKFLIDRKGQVIRRVGPKTKPADFAGDITKLL